MEATEWMKHRLPMFKTICYPSIAKQTNQNFIWIVFVDVRTPRAQQHFIMDVMDKPNMMVVPVDTSGYKSFYQSRIPVVYFLREFVPSTIEYVVTTKIDNDDMFSLTYIDSIQKMLVDQDLPCLIDANQVFAIFRSFRRFKEVPVDKRRVNRLYCSPYITLVERNSPDLYTAFGRGHTTIRKDIPNYQVVPDSAGRIIHTCNLSNKIGPEGTTVIVERKLLEFIKMFGSEVVLHER
jgi:hypothetical protein